MNEVAFAERRHHAGLLATISRLEDKGLGELADEIRLDAENARRRIVEVERGTLVPQSH